MKKRQILAFFLSVVMLVSTFCFLPASAEEEPAYPNAIPVSALLENGAKVTAGAVYSIANAEDLFTFASVCNTANGCFAGATVVLTSDVDLNPGWVASATAPSRTWTPIHLFKGTFDGQGHTVSGIYAIGTPGWGSSTTEEACGFFKTLGGQNVTVKNLNIRNSYFRAVLHVGSVVGAFANNENNTGALISNVTSDAIVVATNYRAGGLVGGIYNSVQSVDSVVTLENCVFNGSATVRYGAVGGMVGNLYRSLRVIRCINNGQLLQSGDANTGMYAGGILGALDAGDICELIGCVNNREIVYSCAGNSKDFRVGGMIGTVNGGALFNMTGCVNLKDITVTTDSNTDNNNNSAVGGMIGYSKSRYMKNSNDRTDKSAELIMTDCVNLGNLSAGSNAVGGLIGTYFHRYATLTGCLNLGTINGGREYRTGAFIGWRYQEGIDGERENILNFTDCFYAAQDDLGAIGVYLSSINSNVTCGVRVRNTALDQDVTLIKSNLTNNAKDTVDAMNVPFATAGCSITASDLTGVNAVMTLISYDWMDGWEIYNNSPVPRQAAKLLKGENKENGVDFYGVQSSAIADNTYDVRMVSTVDSLEYSKVGFEVNFLYNGKTATYTMESGTVYEKLTYQNLEKGETKPELFEVEGKWLSALTVRDVPASGTFVLEMTAFSVDQNDNLSKDDTAVYIFTNGVMVCSYWK